MGWLKAALQFLANLTGVALKNQEVRNAPDMKERAKAQDEVKAQEAVTKNISDRNLDELRRAASE